MIGLSFSKCFSSFTGGIAFFFLLGKTCIVPATIIVAGVTQLSGIGSGFISIVTSIIITLGFGFLLGVNYNSCESSFFCDGSIDNGFMSGSACISISSSNASWVCG